MISVILPTYNEKSNIIDMLKKLTQELQPISFEIIVVDDDAPDGTATVVKSAMSKLENLRLWTRTEKKSLVASIREGSK